MVFCFYTFVSWKYAAGYAGLCCICWLFISYPRFKGENKLKEIRSEEEFDELVEVVSKEKKSKEKSEKKGKKKQDTKQETKLDYTNKGMWVVEFYVTWAMACLHVTSNPLRARRHGQSSR